jgi:hypothetical protein
MGLIVVARFVNRVENRDALLQEVRRLPGAFDLPNGAVSQAGCPEKVPLRGSDGAFL